MNVTWTSAIIAATAAALAGNSFAGGLDPVDLGIAQDSSAIVLLAVSGDCRHVAIASQDKDLQVLRIDGHEVAREPRFVGLALNNDGSRFAYAALKQSLVRVVIDGKQQAGEYRSIDGYRTAAASYAKLCFSPDGSHLAFVAHKGNSFLAVVDGIEGKAYESVGQFAFSPDSKRWAYSASTTGRFGPFVLIVDGKESASYQGISQVAFTPGGNQVAYDASLGVFDGDVIMIGPRKIDAGSSSMSSPFAFNRDGEHFAYAATATDTSGRMSPAIYSEIVVDGNIRRLEPIVPGDSPTILQVAMSPDGRRLAFDRWDVTGETHDRVQGEALIHITRSQPAVVVDGKLGPRLEGVGHIIFSPDSARYAYPGQLAGKWHAFLDGQPGPAFDWIFTTFEFSHDSKHLAYAAKRNGQWIAVLDGKEVPGYRLVVPVFQNISDALYSYDAPPIRFTEGGECCFIGEKDRKYYSVRIAL